MNTIEITDSELRLIAAARVYAESTRAGDTRQIAIYAENLIDKARHVLDGDAGSPVPDSELR